MEVIPGYVSCHTILLSRNLSYDVVLSYTLAGTRRRNLRVYTYQAHQVTKSPTIHPWSIISEHTPVCDHPHMYMLSSVFLLAAAEYNECRPLGLIVSFKPYAKFIVVSLCQISPRFYLSRII